MNSKLSKEAVSELALMQQDLGNQSKEYQPTAFWSKASKLLSKELSEEGFESFRATGATRDFFVPTYGSPGNTLSESFINKIEVLAVEEFGQDSMAHLTLMRSLTGKAWAHSDFRTVVAGDDPEKKPNLRAVSESKIGNPKEHFCFEGRFFSRSFLNYLQGLVFLKKHVCTESISKVLEIGGGFGSLGEILQQSGNYAYVNVDIPPTSAVSTYYLSSLGTHSVIPYSKTRHLSQIECPVPKQSMVLCPWQLPLLEGRFDLAVNFISFQEMEPVVVQNYLNEIDRLETTYVLLRNLREGKPKLSDGAVYGVKTPILGDDYDRFLSNYDLVDTNVAPYGYKTVDGFHSELRLYCRR